MLKYQELAPLVALSVIGNRYKDKVDLLDAAYTSTEY